MTIKEALQYGSQELASQNISEPQKSAEFLLRHILGWDKAKIFSNYEKLLDKAQEKKYKKWISRRLHHEPVWYITGTCEFYGLEFFVNENVLIPRPETEFLVEEVINKLKIKNEKLKIEESKSTIPNTVYRILDLGTGSGAIILAIANKLKMKNEKLKVKEENVTKKAINDCKLQFYASDVSEEALKIAKLNAKKLGLEDDVEFRKGSLLEPWQGEKFDIIVANLPYIPHEDMDSLAFDIHHWEPRLALDGGAGGLEIYEDLFKNVSHFLNPQGNIFIEIGIDQGAKIKKMASKYLKGSNVQVLQDFSDIDRIVKISFGGSKTPKHNT